MIIEPKVRGFICTTAHPAGCRENVRQQIEYTKSMPKTDGAKKVLVIGCSTGYGLSSRIAAAYSCGASTLGIMFERPASGKRTASAGWYNTAAFEEFAHADGLYAKTINGDAFSADIKKQTIELIKADLGTVDLVVYSLAAPRRTMPDGTSVTSVLKTTDQEYTNKTIDLSTRQVSEVSVPPATPEEIDATIKVMGGEDWQDWMHELQNAGVLAENAKTVAYSYIGPQLTYPMYTHGSIGKAKEHLFQTAQEMSREIPGLSAYVSVNKGLVTQASAAIPIVPLYISILYKVMKQAHLHEGCMQQMYRLFHDRLFQPSVPVDAQGYIRIDDWEMREEIQKAVSDAWEKIDNDTLADLADVEGYWEDFYRMFGFHIPEVDYSADVDADVPIPSIS
ncbi:MAG: enoyl-ACP reductase FabV [Christensenella sp.]|nr:enoyl-ACP reductase FabV [Christensenella sp.]